MSEHTTIEAELNNLKPGESLVVLTRDKGKSGGYFLGIGDKNVSNTWAITRAELIKLAGLCEREMRRLEQEKTK